MTEINDLPALPPDGAFAAAAIVETLVISGSPNNLVINRTGTRLYVTDATASGTVTVLSTQPLRILQTITGLGSPISIAINADGSNIYVSDNSVATGTPINVIETLNNTVVETITGFIRVTGIAVNSTGTRLYVADNGASKLVAIETSNYQRVGETSVRNAKTVLVAPDNAHAHVATELDGWVIVDLANNKALATIKTAVGSPTAIGYSPRYPRVYITHRSSGRVTVGDALIPDVSAEINGLKGPTSIAFNRLSEMVYITERDGGQITIIDTRVNRIIGTIKGFIQPRGIVVARDGRDAYVADIANQSISRVRL